MRRAFEPINNFIPVGFFNFLPVTLIRYMDGFVSEAVEVRQNINAIAPALTICPSYSDAYKESALKVSKA